MMLAWLKIQTPRAYETEMLETLEKIGLVNVL